MKERFELLINKYVDGELTGSENNELKELINKNAMFAKHFRAQIKAHNLLGTLQTPRAPDYIPEAIIKRIKRKETAKEQRRFLYLMGALLFSLLAAVILFHKTNSSDFVFFNISTYLNLQMRQISQTIVNFLRRLTNTYFTILIILPFLIFLLLEELEMILKFKGNKRET